jgi:predicted nucleotidyltransferase
MTDRKKPWKKIIDDLTERAKELNCLYQIEELLRDTDSAPDEVLQKVLQIIPSGWQYSPLCRVCLTLEGNEYSTGGFDKARCCQSAPILSEGAEIGRIEICYSEEVGCSGESDPFLPEEQRLLNTIADRLEHYFFQRKLKQAVEQWSHARRQLEVQTKKQWQVVIELLEKSDTKLLAKISRKMLNYLCWIGIEEARELLQSVNLEREKSLGAKPGRGSDLLSGDSPTQALLEDNKPSQKRVIFSTGELSRQIFSIAQRNLSDEEILELIQRWVKENRVGFLVKTLENPDTSLGDLLDAISRYHYIEPEEVEITPYTRQNINVLLIHRLFTEQLDFIDIAKDYVNLHDFYEILRHTIFPQNSHGRLGGKSAGMFIAGQILKRYSQTNPELERIRVPKTWYVTSDTLQAFLSFNDLEEILEQKYKAVEQIREEYPNIVQIFKNSVFPGEIVNWLSACLDDFGEQPIIVRSSSLLEDRMGSAFSGKYKSLFLANQGSKKERLDNLMDAIAEVYASVFSPDPIEYRRERGLVNFHEEMAIMIQEVIGTRVGRYFFPAFAGVAFSHNEFRWSPRIKREDGLLRLVPGLGTRAVDRLADDYPRLVAPGQPGLNVNTTVDETLYYSPRKIDVIDLEKNSFTTVDFTELLREAGELYPNIENIVSVHQDGLLQRKSRFALNFERDDLVPTFEGLVSNTTFVREMKILLDILREKIGKPVDVEFAVSGQETYLLQCRSQSAGAEIRPAAIPKDLPSEKILFNARKYVSNGLVPNITHVVYVDPDGYSSLQTPEQIKNAGRAIGRLNSLLPKRQFILMGPGRWGSRGDIKLGVPVTYSEINNTAVLVEIARQKGNYVPDLSFGTHFFQDLVEASIRYLPLYPDDPGVLFNESFLCQSENILDRLVPEYGNLQEVIRVIDIPKAADGQVLYIAMNADADEAVAYFSTEQGPSTVEDTGSYRPPIQMSDHWRWRMRMADQIARELDPQRFGVEAMYVIGSTKNATATAASDIDLLVHFRGSEAQKRELLSWFEGWSLSLAELNYMRTGIRTERLLDVHLVTDEDIERKSSYAVKIGAVTDAAKPIPLGK